jgi:4-oxalocrotonate tautomerase
MLVVKVTMLEGRTLEQKEALIERLSAAASKHLDCPLAEVRVVIYEVARSNWGIGGHSIAKREEQKQ